MTSVTPVGAGDPDDPAPTGPHAEPDGNVYCADVDGGRLVIGFAVDTAPGMALRPLVVVAGHRLTLGEARVAEQTMRELRHAMSIAARLTC